MNPNQRSRLGRVALLSAALAAAGLSAGCIVVPARGYHARAAVVAPAPAPQYEVLGVAPYPGAVWISGYWGWNSGRRVWNPGRWDAPRRGGPRYEPQM